MVWGATCVRMAVAFRTCKAHGRAVVEEVRGTTDGGRIVSGLFPEEFEEFDSLSRGEDVQEAQKLSMDGEFLMC